MQGREAPRDRLRWMVLPGVITASLLIRFLQYLVQDARHQVFLILGNLPVHRARSVRAWLAGHSSEIEVFRLLSYSS